MNTVWGTPGLGEVIIKGQQITNHRIADCLQAVKHGNGRDWWLVTKFSDANLTTLNRFAVFLVTSNGISNPVFYDFNDAMDMDFQKIIFNNSYTKIMNINLYGYMCEFDFDRCSGVISNPHVIYPEITSLPYNRVFWEGAYSPNDSVFYIATNRYPLLLNCYLLQFDLTASDIPASCDTLDDYLFPIEPGAVRLAPDGKIYYSRAYKSPGVNSYPYADSMYNYINMNLSVINEPDNIGAACNYQPFSFYLGGKRTYYGLPNNPDYDLGALAGSVCDTITGIAPSPLERGEVRFYPNPAKEKVRFEYSEPVSENSQIEVYDNLGVMVKKIILTKGSISTTFSINDLPPGMYLCRVFINNAYSQSNKLIIIR
ncbi:MAG TPA: T9SS type A sorting domain-containing protein [Bacteroidia bacterium]|nr:T9SS type A sorting domain-containing protein [Bacteroidia bacterium]